MEERLQENLGKKIMEIRKEKGMSKIEFAEKVGINRTTLYLYESGKRMVPSELIYRVWEVFGIEPNEVFGVKS